MPQTLLTHLEKQQPALLADIRQLVELETPSRDEAALNAAADLVGGWLKGLGATITHHPVAGYGTHVEARLAGPAGARPALVLVHMDTVHPQGSVATKMAVREEGGRLYGPGTCDMKGGLVMGYHALRALVDLGRTLPRPVIFLATCDEEIGSPTSRPLIERLAREAAYALVLELPGPNGAVKTARKGTGMYNLEVTGRAGHAGNDYFVGISANRELAQMVLTLHNLSSRETGTTVNVGQMQGGTARNVVAETATAQVDVRFWTQAEADLVDAVVRSLQPEHGEARLAVTGGVNRPPMERTAETARLFAHAQALGAALDYPLTEAAVGGASDGNFTASVGLPTLDGLGAPGAGAHTTGEYLEVGHLAARTALLARLLETL